MSRYYVSCQTKNRRWITHWVSLASGGLGLVDWSYGMTYFDTLEEAENVGRMAQEKWPKRRFRVDQHANDGNAYKPIKEIDPPTLPQTA